MAHVLRIWPVTAAAPHSNTGWRNVQRLLAFGKSCTKMQLLGFYPAL